MKLYFFRHGEAKPDGDDELRSLTKEGALTVKEVGKAFWKLGFHFDMIFSSPLKRAIQTAQIVAKEVKFHEDIFEENELRPGAGINELEAIIGRHPEIDSALIVGHAPDLGIMAASLAGSDEPLSIKKAGLALVKATWNEGKLTGILELFTTSDEIISG